MKQFDFSNGMDAYLQFRYIYQYELGPIMKELGKKLQEELPHGSYVLSNVFTFPGWTPLRNSTLNAEKTYIYRIPDCYDATESAREDSIKTTKQKV